MATKQQLSDAAHDKFVNEADADPKSELTKKAAAAVNSRRRQSSPRSSGPGWAQQLLNTLGRVERSLADLDLLLAQLVVRFRNQSRCGCGAALRNQSERRGGSPAERLESGELSEDEYFADLRFEQLDLGGS